MTAVPVDRRVRRSRAALQRALVELVLEKGYDGVSVDAIAERADVTRATFYAHFLNKEDLLTAVVDDLADEVLATFAEQAVGPSPAGRLALLLEQVGQQRDVMRLVVRGEGDGAPLRRFTERIEEVVAADLGARPGASEGPSRVPLDLLVRLRSASIVATVSWYLDHPEADPAETADAAHRTVERGLTWAIGRPPR